MPRDYQNTIIYRLVCKDTNIKDCYVGHTTNFKLRKHQHKTACCNEKGRDYNYKVYQFIRANGGWDNWAMLEIEKYPCSDAREAGAREFYNYELYNATLNSQVPNRAFKEWYEYNKDEIVEQRKQFYCENKEQILETNKKYREENKEYFKQYKQQYYKQHKTALLEQQKQYYENNKDTKKLYKQQYYAGNKDTILSKNKKYRDNNRDKLNQKRREKYQQAMNSLNI